MIKRKYANMRIYDYNIDFEDVENTITYSLSAKNLENNLNKREEELCNKISDLEAKLADRTEQLKIALKDFNDIQRESDKLAQQLAEKDKKIEDVEDVSRRLIRTCGKTNCYGKNQTAITELEKIKKEINLRPVIVRNCGYGDFEEILLEDVYDVIDQQIAELKGEK